MRLGTANVTALKVGSENASKAYLGATLVWEAAGSGGAGPDGTNYYVEVTIPTTSVASTLTDYPVYVDLSDMPAAFWTHVQSDGGDIRVTQADGTTRCPTELVAIDTGAETGELHFLAPTISSATNTTYRIYYGHGALSQPAVGDAYGRNAVWADYAAVWHMQENPASGDIIDATGNGNDLTPTNMDGANQATGKLAGNALAFNGANEYLAAADDATLDFTSAYTLSGWMICADAEWSTIVAKGLSGDANEAYELAVVRKNPDLAGRHGGTNYPHALAASPSSTLFDHFARTYGGNTVTDYFRGVNDGSTGGLSDLSATTGTVRVGRRFTAFENYTQGTIDEVRLAPTALSADRIAAEYSNQNTPGSFYSVGAEQSA